MDFTDVEARWEVLAAYTRTGLNRGEKVMIVLDPSDLSDDAAVSGLDGGTGQVEAGRESGQFALHRNTPLYLPDGRFDMERQIRTYAAAIERAGEEGHQGLRVGADMGWAARPEVDDEQLVDYETSASLLFGPFTDFRFTAICWYDRRRFSDHVVATMRTIHPLRVMEHLGALEVTRAPDGVRLIGSAERETRGEFTEALCEVLDRRPEHGPFRFELDLTDLCYMEAHCAWQLIGFADSLPEDDKLVVRCGSMLETVLRGLGSDDIPKLELRTEGADNGEDAA